MGLSASAKETLDVADRLFNAIERGDVDAIKSIYTPQTKIWHNFDNIAQSVEENLAVLRWVVANIAEIKYSEVRRQPTPGGFVQQHVLRGKVKSSGKEIAIPACIVCTVENGRITRLDEYLDSVQTASLRG
jgi:ketosteroid isomerase-like protein